ncbi:MAG: hypothetical protein HQL56_14595 [Magnetococcales bacterium]|nr:hypothetical protein [Magnetococcales bacterium]
MSDLSLFLVTEDPLGEALIRAMIQQSGILFNIEGKGSVGGKGAIRSRMVSYNQLARQYPVLVLTDLDDALCPGSLLEEWLPEPAARGLLFRLAVREAEAWVMAHREALASFLAIPETKIPQRPDELPDAKGSFLQLIRKSKNNRLKKEMLPDPEQATPIGLHYNEHLKNFVFGHWRVKTALENSPSLSRTWKRLLEIPHLFSEKRV